MKVLAIPSLLLLSASLYAQDYSGNWKETARTDRQNKPVAFKDTMRLAEVTKDSLKIRRGAFLYPGAIYNDLLEMTYKQYQVVKLTPSEIRLGDDAYIYVFSKETRSTASAAMDGDRKQAQLPEAPVTSIDPALLNGRWQSYNRRKKDGAAGKINYQTLLKSATINNTGGTLTGNVYAQSGDGSPLYTILKTDGSGIIVADTEKKNHTLTVWKLTKDELVIEDEDGILYYMKQF